MSKGQKQGWALPGGGIGGSDKGSEAIANETPSLEELYESAGIFSRAGLRDEALQAYESLLSQGFDPARVIPHYLETLFSKLPPEQVPQHLRIVLKTHSLPDQQGVQVLSQAALEMERRGLKVLALELYEAAHRQAPQQRALEQKVSSLRASLSAASRYDYLLQSGKVTPQDLQRAFSMAKKLKKSVESVLIDQFKIPKADIGRSLSMYYGCPFREFDPKVQVPSELIRNLKKSFLLHDLWVPLSWSKEGVEILVDDPGDLSKTGQIGGLLKSRRLTFSVGIKEDIEQYIHHFFEHPPPQVEEGMLEALEALPGIEFGEEPDFQEAEEVFMDEQSSQVVRLVDQVIVMAYRKNASDIHIEPSPHTNKTAIRYRLDGVCQEYLEVPNTMARGILSRIKIMAGLDIAEKRLPQDGKIKFKRKDMPSFELRVATLPTTGGHEDAVLRILPQSGAMGLDQMGLTDRNLKVLKRIIAQPYGLVLVSGPTGSGKTTTLHACLAYINWPGIKIWTAEDPVEITQPGLRQVEVKPKIGLDFARVMRAFLRADPDVIMIGEMRDFETASIGIEASLTGHLVLSTLHTNSAPETVTRLLDMGLNALNFSDALLGVLAQRLVRRLCPECKEPYHPTEEEFEDLVLEYGAEAFAKTQIQYGPDLTLYRPVGCMACSQTGYKGRMGIHELMEGTKEIKRLIKRQGTSEDLLQQATEQGMITLKQDGILKMLRGLTDIKEIRRVCVT